MLSLLDYLKMCGMEVDPIPGWEARKSGSGLFAPVGVMVHHTAGVNSLKRCVDLKLVQFLIPKDGRTKLISQNRTGHPGTGRKEVVDRCRAGLPPLGDAKDHYPKGDNVAGYQYFWGIEVENLGNGRDPYPPEQIEAMLRLCAALCRLHGWGGERVVHHREFTYRKIDMTWREAFGHNVRDWTNLYLFLLDQHWKELEAFFASLGGYHEPEGVDGGR